MAPTWNPDDYSDRTVKEVVSGLIELANEYSDFVYLKKDKPNQSGLMIRDRNSTLALMEYRPRENRMFARPERYEVLSKSISVPKSLINDFHSDIELCRGYINNPMIFINHLRKIFDAMYLENALAGEPASQLSRQIGDNSQHLGYYLPKWEDYENTRRKLLRKGEKRVSTNKLLDIMQNDLVAAGYKLLQSWRSETKKNIEVWRQRKD